MLKTAVVLGGYLLVIVGSLGMMAFATKFGLATTMVEHRLSEGRFLGMNGAQVWFRSWVFIVVGTVLQLLGYFVPAGTVVKASSVVLLSDIADMSCEVASAQAGRPASMEAGCRAINQDLKSQFYTAFRSERVCDGLQLVTLEDNFPIVPGYYLDMYVSSGPDARVLREWQWNMNGAKYTGTAANSGLAAHQVCVVVKGPGSA
jgi:hypothetical protein